MHALVTGATGFVGHHLAPALTTAGHDVAAMTRHPEAYTGPGAAATGPWASPTPRPRPWPPGPSAWRPPRRDRAAGMLAGMKVPALLRPAPGRPPPEPAATVNRRRWVVGATLVVGVALLAATLVV